tara:strand:- start:338 stop:1042 length:705 start_codon:yes stop_codon:yes gene_type:complete
MKIFKHKTINLPEIKAKTTDGVRLYETPEGNFYPSITTVLSTRNKEGLFKWRERVGNDVANYVARKAATRGTHVHHMCEDYINNDFDEEKHKKKFLPYTLFTQLRDSALQKIDNVYAQECGLYSDKYMVAGRVDCIADYDGIPSIIDFKTSTSERKDSYNENYYIQASAYAEMFEERTGIAINQIAILVITEDGVVQEFIKDKLEYLSLLKDTIKDWKEKNVVYNSNILELNNT